MKMNQIVFPERLCSVIADALADKLEEVKELLPKERRELAEQYGYTMWSQLVSEAEMLIRALRA